MNSRGVLIVGNFLSEHGLARGVCEELAPRIRGLGWRVLTTSDRYRRALRLLDMLSTVWSHRNDYDVAQVDVFSGRSFLWAEAVCWLLRRVHRPYILTLHGGGLPEFAAGHKRRVTKLLNSAAAVTVPSRYLQDRMAGYRSELLLIPNAVDLAVYRRRHPHFSLRPRLIWLRAFHDIYAPEIAVKALARLKDEFPSIRLTMVGADKGDNSRQRTRAAARAYGLEEQLEMRESVPKALVPDLLKTGDIFLNSSTIDNNPVSVLEAMASGMCVVSTDAGGIPFLLTSGQDALLVPVNDDAAMAAAVRSLLTDKALAGRIRNGSLRSVNAYDWSKVLPQWQRLLTSTVRTAGPNHLGTDVRNES